MARLLVVHHTPSPAMHAMFLEALAGANDPAIDGVDVVVRPALTASATDVLEADGYLLGTPVNLGYISGALKHFFDQIYYPCLEATMGRPFGAYLHGDNDTTGAVRAIDAITTGLSWRRVQQYVTATGPVDGSLLTQCRELGGALAAGLSLGI
jgi:NAD(P)H-dependent FMN reductase